MSSEETSRWDAFAPWEIAAMDEFFQNFAPQRSYSADIQKIKQEIRTNMERRQIKAYWRNPAENEHGRGAGTRGKRL